MSGPWEVTALKYAERTDRRRGENFILDDDPHVTHPLDYFIWVLRRGAEVIVVDSGFDDAEAGQRQQPILRHPAEALAAMNIRAEAVETLVITHMHYDHAGGLGRFPNARIHLQAAEMAYATGPCMCHEALKRPYTADHVCELVRRVYSGRVIFHDGVGEIAEGVTVHPIGGHSRGLQAVRVRTESGWLCLASDAAHYYENALLRKPFPVVVDMQIMLDGFAAVERLASDPSLLVPGHDPLVTEIFPTVDRIDFAFRLDKGATRPIRF